MSISVGKKIKEALDINGKKQKDLVQYLGENQATVSKWLTSNEKLNRDMPYDILKKTAIFLNLSIDYLLDNSRSIEKFIPLIGKASCGVPNEYDLNGFEAVPVDSKLYAEGMYAVEAEGDSMSSKINDSDLVYCVPCNDIHDANNKIVHYTLNGESGIKKLKVNDAGTIISLIPLNLEHDIITIDHYENCTLKLAKVVGVVDTNF